MKNLLITLFISLFLASCSKEAEEKSVVEEKKAEPVNQPKKTLEADVVEFWKLVSQQKVKEAVAKADDLVKDSSGQVPGFYIDLFNREKIKTTVLSRKNFNEVDFFFWTQAQFLKSLVNNIMVKEGNDDLVETLYKSVVSKLKSKSETEDIGVYPVHIWNRGFGVCDRQAWVMCELAYQAGARASIIYLINPETNQSPHTVCEVALNGKHYIIDPIYKKLLKETKFTDLTPEKIKETWPEKPEIHNAFEKAVRLVPSMPIDYAERNQRLSARLGNLIRFAEPPQNRFHFWKEAYPAMSIEFWGYSLRILKNTQFYKDAEK